MFFFFSSRRRHTRWPRDWSSDVCSSDLCVRTAEEQGKELWDLSDQELTEISEHLDDSVRSEIGRASCRERVEEQVVVVPVENKREEVAARVRNVSMGDACGRGDSQARTD